MKEMKQILRNNRKKKHRHFVKNKKIIDHIYKKNKVKDYDYILDRFDKEGRVNSPTISEV